jgi:hypothetical protein
VPLRPEPEERGGAAERCAQIRHRRDSDPAGDQERPRDVEVEAVPERAEHRDHIASSQRTQGARAGPDGVDQEPELALRREAQAHRPREHAPGRLEHEELARRPRLEPASLDAEERVRPNARDTRDPKALPPSNPEAE